MKKYLTTLGIFTLFLGACGPVYVTEQTPPPPPAPVPVAEPGPEPEDVTYQTFYDQLSPYGQWIQTPEYGYVWMPEAGSQFKPYGTNGHWVCTDEGWAWESGYPWGWATFHYGRWYFQDGYGWMWVPGNQWAPAWVQWRNSGEYYGWAAMGPNVSVNIAMGGGYTPPPYYWNFVPHEYVASPQVNNYYVHETNNVTIINNSTVINNNYYNNTVVNNNSVHNNIHYGGGPDPNEVSRFSGTAIRPEAVRESNRPAAQSMGGSFAVYRPRVNANAAGGNRPGAGFNRPAPAQVTTMDNARPVNRNSYGGFGNNDWRGGNPNRAASGYSNNPGNQPAQGFNQPNNRPVNDNPFARPGARPYNQPANNQPMSNPAMSNPLVNNPYNPPASNPPANNPPANNRPIFNRPPNDNPYLRPGAQPYNPPVNNRPVYNAPVNNPPVNRQPAVQPQPRQIESRPGNGFGRPFSQNDNNSQARPVTNSPNPAPMQRVPAPQPGKDEPRRFERP